MARPACAQGFLGLGCALAGSADQHHLVAEVGTDLVAMLAQEVQRHVVGAGDVHGLELPRRADVENAWRRHQS